MKFFTDHKAIWLGIAILIFGADNAFAQGQSRPLMQDIQVQRELPQPSATPLIKRTGSSAPVRDDVVTAGGMSPSAVRTSVPVLADVMIPGISGILVESLNGETVVESGSNIALNPASNVKVATTYAVLKTFGPNYRFQTNVWTDGAYDPQTATLQGNIYVTGRDPVFSAEHAVYIANELNRMGIRRIEGDLIVADSFVMNHSAATSRTSQLLFATLDAGKRSAAANRSWASYRILSGKGTSLNEIPGVTFTGAVYVQPLPSELRLLFSHESAPMRDIVKVMMSYSNNFLAERLGDMVGGPYGVAGLVHRNAGVSPMEFSLQTSSGLGINRVTASAMMRLLRTLRNELAGMNMTFADVMPVAGMDKGTLEGRFASDFSRGSVVGKTGTLGNTDGGVSALAGEVHTRNGTFLFVIFNQRGSVPRFRSFQNNYVSLIQGQFGGAAPTAYSPISLDTKLANTRISYPDGRPRISE